MTTPFEASAGANLTTYAEEIAYVDTLLGARLTKIPLATTVQGREVYALRVGAVSASNPPLVIESSVHGNEPGPREAAFALARDWAASTDSTVSGFLDTTPVYIVPCVNPDGRAVNTRNNANNVDINRDFIKVTQAETRGIANLLRDAAPVALLSSHEIPSTSNGPTENVEVDHPVFPGIQSALRTLAASTTSDIRSGLTALGIINGPYFWSINTFGALTMASGLIGATTVLLEANATSHANAGTPWQRYGWLIEATNLWLDYNITNYATVAQNAAAARATVAAKALGGPPSWHVTNSTTVTATGYRLTGAQYATAQAMLEAWGIPAVPDGSDWLVWLTHDIAGQTVLALDPSSGSRLLAATRLTDTPPPTIDRRRAAAVVGLI